MAVIGGLLLIKQFAYLLQYVTVITVLALIYTHSFNSFKILTVSKIVRCTVYLSVSESQQRRMFKQQWTNADLVAIAWTSL